jgi:hypothetical protein
VTDVYMQGSDICSIYIVFSDSEDYQKSNKP